MSSERWGDSWQSKQWVSGCGLVHSCFTVSSRDACSLQWHFTALYILTVSVISSEVTDLNRFREGWRGVLPEYFRYENSLSESSCSKNYTSLTRIKAWKWKTLTTIKKSCCLVWNVFWVLSFSLFFRAKCEMKAQHSHRYNSLFEVTRVLFQWKRSRSWRRQWLKNGQPERRNECHAPRLSSISFLSIRVLHLCLFLICLFFPLMLCIHRRATSPTLWHARSPSSMKLL